MEKIIPLFSIAILYYDCYPDVKSWYLVGNPTLVNFKLLNLKGLLSRKETRQKSLRLLSSTPLATANCVSGAQEKPPPTGRP